MLKAAAATILTTALRRVAGRAEAGPVTTALIGTGASMLLTRGRRPLGVVLLGAGGYLLWREAREQPVPPVRRP